MLHGATDATETLARNIRDQTVPQEHLELMTAHLHAVGNVCWDATKVAQTLSAEGASAALRKYQQQAVLAEKRSLRG